MCKGLDSNLFQKLFIRCVNGRGFLIHPLTKVYYADKNEILSYSGVTGKVSMVTRENTTNLLYDRLIDMLHSSNKEEKMFITRIHTTTKNYELTEVFPTIIESFDRLVELDSRGLLDLNFVGQLIYNSNNCSWVKDGNCVDSLKAFTDVIFKRKSKGLTMDNDIMDYVYSVWSGDKSVEYDKYLSQEEKDLEYSVRKEREQQASDLLNKRNAFDSIFKPMQEKWLQFGLDIATLVNFETHTISDLKVLDSKLNNSIRYTYSGQEISKCQYTRLCRGLRL